MIYRHLSNIFPNFLILHAIITALISTKFIQTIYIVTGPLQVNKLTYDLLSTLVYENNDH